MLSLSYLIISVEYKFTSAGLTTNIQWAIHKVNIEDIGRSHFCSAHSMMPVVCEDVELL